MWGYRVRKRRAPKGALRRRNESLLKPADRVSESPERQKVHYDMGSGESETMIQPSRQKAPSAKRRIKT